jgi:DNA topoisomerase-1
MTAAPEAVQDAKEAGLRYVTDETPGIARRKTRTGFRYVGPDGEPVRDPKQLERIKKLAIPPAWTDVWICPSPRGHLQATGRDAKGRKQYRYHEKWREVRDENKFEHMLAFSQALPKIRERVDQDLGLRGLPREKVLAAVVRLLEETLIRVGNEEYAQANKSFGLTTMRDRHVKIEGSEVRFSFRGKSGQRHKVELHDRRLAKIVQRCRDLPGQELFQYLDDAGEHQTIDSADVNAYLHEITGEHFTAKDFRTWAGAVLCACELRGIEHVSSETEAKHYIVEAVKHVAERLGNTPAVCRKAYIHPAIFESFLSGHLAPAFAFPDDGAPISKHDLVAEERAVVRLLGSG